MESDGKLLARSVEEVRVAETLDEAVVAVVECLRPRFDLWHTSICTHPAGQPNMKILASWSLADSVFDAGAEVSATISRMIVAVLSALREGNPVAFTVGGEADSLVEHLLGKQGVASVVAIPISHDESGLLFLALGAGTQDAFHDAGNRFFTDLAAGIADTVVRLVGAVHDTGIS
ncbi:MAG TPA: hypothetical protein VNC22_04030 [Sporichthya sp.]|nr:hypothetical protein [Sporichthya sp.]